jgi:hypothetical protein
MEIALEATQLLNGLQIIRLLMIAIQCYSIYLPIAISLQNKKERKYSAKVSAALGFTEVTNLSCVQRKNHLMVMETAVHGEIFGDLESHLMVILTS